MKIIKPYCRIETDLSKENVVRMLKSIEDSGRICYQSSHKITENSYLDFIKNKINIGKINAHESVIEHEYLKVRFICDRGISHELVRHRIAAFSQESTRFCNYSTDKFDKHLTFIQPCWFRNNYTGEHDNISEILYLDFENEAVKSWIFHCYNNENLYHSLINDGWKPEEARSILPNSLKTEIVITADLREWRHIFKMRTSNKAHPQMRELMIPLLNELKSIIPIIFDNI